MPIATFDTLTNYLANEFATDLRTRQVVLIVDHDGTIAPIVRNPDEAAPLPEALTALTTLANQPGCTVAIVSGRPITFLAERFPGTDIDLYGLYGIEQRVDGQSREHDTAVQCRALVSKLERSYNQLREFEGQGAYLEYKGASLAIHWRALNTESPEKAQLLERAVTEWADEVCKDPASPLRPKGGKMVLELAPDMTKAQAAEAILATHRSFNGELPIVICLGDDKGDIPMFEWNLNMKHAGRAHQSLNILVKGGNETPNTLLELATHVLEHPRDAASVLMEAAQIVSQVRGLERVSWDLPHNVPHHDAASRGAAVASTAVTTTEIAAVSKTQGKQEMLHRQGPSAPVLSR